MAGTNKLGVYWGVDGISLVEVAKSVPLETAYVSFDELQIGNLTNTVTEDVRLLELLQKAVRNKGFSTTEAYLSLPSRDIIVRWFLIPWLKPHEVQGVVAFEARKYIPFQLEELIYTYYPSTILRGGVKQIGVLFTAIRKDSYKKYVNVLSQSGMNVVYSEPSCMSFLRTLFTKKVLDANQVAAVLTMDQDGGELNIVSDGFVKFIRDFRLSTPQSADNDGGEEVLRAKLYNEVRISFDFFNRQHPETEVSRIISFTSSMNKTLCAGLSDDLGIPVLPVDTVSLLDRAGITDMGAANAFGVALSGSVREVIDLNLSEGDASCAVSAKDEKKTIKIPSFMFPVIAGVFLVFVLGFIWTVTSALLLEKGKKVAALNNSLGKFSDVSLDDIEFKRSAERKVLNAINSLELRSSVTPLVVRVFQLIPNGMWLSTVNVMYVQSDAGSKKNADDSASQDSGKTKSSVNLLLTGKIYLGDGNSEFDAVNRFIMTLRTDAKVAAFLKDIKLTSLKTETLGKNTVTVFSINCQ
ncbi:MAG: pilus assembly protein PilM [Candidatus Omnitrophica bacterium]|nr:pilus assembly protein PilM [Candidatus Omnitrophota bacterium]